MKRDSVSVYKHIRRDTSSPYTQVQAFWMTPPSPHQLRTYLSDDPFSN